MMYVYRIDGKYWPVVVTIGRMVLARVGELG